MDEQNITLRIAGKEYPLKAKSPEAEQIMRLAAEEINAMLVRYNNAYPDKGDYDKLMFVTLSQTMGKISVGRASAKLEKGLEDLDDTLGSYLAGIEKNR